MKTHKSLTKKIFRAVQFGANIGIIAIALVLAFLIVDRFVISRDSEPIIVGSTLPSIPEAGPQNLIGKVIPLNEVDWEQNGTTVILYLSTTCRYCTESSPFYQRLKAAKAGNNFRLVAVFPQDINESTKYLEILNFRADQILSASLNSIGVTGTPTLMLVTENGVVYEAWRGKLKEDVENEVLAKLAKLR